MKVLLNGEMIETECSTLSALLESLNHDESAVATAVNKAFVPIAQRHSYSLQSGDLIEIIAPMAGG